MAVSAIGQDALGDEIIEALDAKGLKYYIERLSYPTGTVQVTLDEKGIPQYEIKTDVAWDNIPYTAELDAMAKQCRAVCFGSLAQRHAVSRETINRFLDNMPEDEGQLKIFDINLRQQFYNKEVLENSFRKCNVLKINDEELLVVSKMFDIESTDFEVICRELLAEYQLKMLILTCGVDGSYIFTEHITSFQPTPKVEVADTVGAGDSFTGSFCAAILKGLPITQAHELAVKVSAFVCTQQGAMPVLPEELTKA